MFAIIQNDPEVPAGTLCDLLHVAGEPFAITPAYEAVPPDPATLVGAIVLGGAMGVHETDRHPFLLEVEHFMDAALRLRVPLLGICLGGQLLARIAGGSVTAASPHGERGISGVELTAEGAADPLFAGVPGSFTTFQWHDDSFLPPRSARLLASSPACPWQAFRLDGLAYGLQFHPEVDRAIVSRWSAATETAQECRDAFDAARDPFDRDSRAILANFIRIARNADRS